MFYIYRNLHTGGFSVRTGGYVIHRTNHALATGVNFKVNPGGRKRVLEHKSKNVHAFVVSNQCRVFDDKYLAVDSAKTDWGILPSISYNPYLADHFVCNGKPIYKADRVLFLDGKCYLID